MTITTAAIFTAFLTTSASAAILAGGPSYVPIPSNCGVPNPLPPIAPSTQPPGNYSSTGWAPTTAALQSKVYAYYLPLPDTQSPAARWEGCLQQCNGLSTCKSAMIGDGVPTPKGYYGTDGGVNSRACFMFGRKLNTTDFEKTSGASQGAWEKETAGNIVCPGS